MFGGLVDLPGVVKRVQGVVLQVEGERHSVVDVTGGSILVRQLQREQWPEVMDPDLLEEVLDYDWLDGSSVLLLWAELASEAEEIDLELSLHESLGKSFLPDQEDAQKVAEDYLEEGAFLEGITAARAACAAEPTSAGRLELLAKCYHRLGENRRAFALLRRALSHEPDNRSVLLNLGRLHLAYDQQEQALPYIQQVLDADPEDQEAQTLYGQCCLDNPELREQGVELLLKLQPDDPDLLRMLVAALGASGRVDEALVHLDKILEETEDDGLMYLQGHLLLRAGRAGDAVDALAGALALGNECSWVHRALGAACWATGDEEAALGCFEEALASAERDLDELDSMGADDLLLAAALCGELDLTTGHRALLDALDSWDRDQLHKEVELLLGLSAPHPEQLEFLVEKTEADKL